MLSYLEEAEKSGKGILKKKLLEWGGALDRCARKEEELRKADRLRREHRKLWEKSDLAQAEAALAEIDRLYEGEVRRIQGAITEILRQKTEMDDRIARLEKEEQQFLLLRFGKGYGFDYISMRMHMSRASLFRLQDKILRELEEG